LFKNNVNVSRCDVIGKSLKIPSCEKDIKLASVAVYFLNSIFCEGVACAILIRR